MDYQKFNRTNVIIELIGCAAAAVWAVVNLFLAESNPVIPFFAIIIAGIIKNIRIIKLTEQENYQQESYAESQKNSYKNNRTLYIISAVCSCVVLVLVILKDYRTNIFSVDVKGTGAGGAFITVKDIISFWICLPDGKLISKELVSDMLSKQSGDGADPEEGYYGYGVWIIDNPKGKDFAYFQGCDPGVSFMSEYNPNNGIISVLVSNYGDNVWSEMRKIREQLY